MSHLRIVPLGGLGEIGMNCLALESPEGIVLIDCGVTFPHEENGIDLIHPAFDYLADRWDDLLGVLVTHGHEDHIGAIPYLLRQRDVPVYAPPYALGLMRERFREFPDLKPTLRPTRPRTRFDLGPFVVEPLRVTLDPRRHRARDPERRGDRDPHRGLQARRRPRRRREHRPRPL
ncbi:MAG: MBL fold metallo-hydrolase [Polyangiales bacterium]